MPGTCLDIVNKHHQSQVTFSASKHHCSVAEEQAQSTLRSLTIASESQRAAEMSSQMLETKLHTTQVCPYAWLDSTGVDLLRASWQV